MNDQIVAAQTNEFSGLTRSLPRRTYLALVQISFKVQAVYFARESALAWLSTFPGDLGMGLCYARALLAEGRPQHAIPILDGLCRADPVWEDALRVHLQARLEAQRKNTNEQKSTAPGREAAALFSPLQLQASIYALSGQSVDQQSLPGWVVELRQARQALQSGDLLAAQAFIRQVLGASQGKLLQSTPLAALTHLQVLAASPAIPLRARCEIAERYYSYWPDTLAFMLYLADWSIESGDVNRSVALLHQAAARDVAGQVPTRIWGKNHLYLPLWTTDLQLPLKLPVPAEVMAALGWNRLPAGETLQVAVPEPVVEKVVSPPTAGKEHTGLPVSNPNLVQNLKQPTIVIDEQELDAWLKGRSTDSSLPVQRSEAAGIEVSPESKLALENSDIVETAKKAGEVNQEQLAAIRSLRKDMERLAQSLHKPSLARLDGRSPVYVIFSVRNRLHVLYGTQVALDLEASMQSLAQVVAKEHGWSARVLLADDPESASASGLKPVRPGDAWALKRSLADLDAALSKRGQMIGAVLIVGGPEIVPFHHLPNPVDDQDKDVPSDNPYATRDENYFVPEWPVGRLAGGAGNDATLLQKLLERITAQHTARVNSGQHISWYRRWWFWLSGQNWLPVPKLVSKNGAGSNFGYTAEIWKNAARAVFQTIGDSKALYSSPPCGVMDQVDSISTKAGSTEQKKQAIPVPEGKLGYFNLHGIPDGSEWYGQRDPLSDAVGPDYPVALRPQDVVINGRGKAAFPQLIFSEACYGLNIQDKSIEDAIALKFLEQGSQGVAGSTCMAYGTVGEPLMAADQLGQTFWRLVRQGLPTGEALRQAKIHLASNMHHRQGYLDGEDQKTLISFVFYGDPLAQPLESVHTGKRVLRQSGPQPAPPLVCENSACPLVEMNSASGLDFPAGAPITDEILDSVRQVVERYLPGMRGAQVKIVQPHPICLVHGKACSGKNIQSKLPKDPSQEQTPTLPRMHRLITLSKQIPDEHRPHTSIARLTLDEQGRLVKLVVSR